MIEPRLAELDLIVAAGRELRIGGAGAAELQNPSLQQPELRIDSILAQQFARAWAWLADVDGQGDLRLGAAADILRSDVTLGRAFESDTPHDLGQAKKRPTADAGRPIG